MSKAFEQTAEEPSLFKLRVPKSHLNHLKRDDLDEVSRQEVIYKILKDQLRIHQKTLIDLKEKNKRTKVIKLEPKAFIKAIKPFELHGPQRNLSPELKRQVKNLSIPQRKYYYCPACKTYEEVDFDPIENLNKFMEMLKKEQHKVNPPPRDDDSVAEITDLEEQFILSKYYKKENPEFYKK